jgi:hypothetical protein
MEISLIVAVCLALAVGGAGAKIVPGPGSIIQNLG